MVTSGYGPRTAWHGCTHMVWWNDSQDFTGTPCDAHASIVRAPQGIFNVRDPQGRSTTPLRTRKGIDTTRIGKNAARASYLAVRGLRSPHGLFTGSLVFQNPYGTRKLILHALKLYGPRTGRQNSYGAARGSCGPREWTYDFCSKQPGNNPHGTRECDVTGALLPAM